MMRLFAVGMALATLLISMRADADMMLLGVGGTANQGGGGPASFYLINSGGDHFLIDSGGDKYVRQ